MINNFVFFLSKKIVKKTSKTTPEIPSIVAVALLIPVLHTLPFRHHEIVPQDLPRRLGNRQLLLLLLLLLLFLFLLLCGCGFGDGVGVFEEVDEVALGDGFEDRVLFEFGFSFLLDFIFGLLLMFADRVEKLDDAASR